MNSMMISDAAMDNEARIVQRAISGDRQAFTQLFDQFYEPINRYFFFHLTQASDADDLSGTVFLQAWRNIKKFDPSKGTFKAWLYRIAHNLLVDHYRSQKEKVSLDDINDLPSTTDSSEQTLIEQQQVMQLKQALLRLDERSRDVLICRYVSEMSHRETARMLKLSEGNVRVIQMRALEKMKGFFAEDQDE